MSTATLTRWGNGQGVLIPKRLCEQLGIKTGDKVTISAERKRIIIEQPAEKHTLEARMRDWDGQGVSFGECDWGTSAGQEMW